jgi:hypothetical protein
MSSWFGNCKTGGAFKVFRSNDAVLPVIGVQMIRTKHQPTIDTTANAFDI